MCKSWQQKESSDNEKSHQEIWFGRSHKEEQDLIFENVGCVIMHSGSHGWAVTWEEVVQYGVPR